MEARKKGMLLLLISPLCIGGFILLPMYLAYVGVERVWYSPVLAGLSVVWPLLAIGYFVFGDRLTEMYAIGKNDNLSVLHVILLLFPLPFPFIVGYFVDAYMKSKGYS